MSNLKLSENTIRLAVVILSIIGVSILILISALSDVPVVDISHIDDHNGETIRTEGMVIGQNVGSSGSSSILIADREGNTAEVSIESSDIEVDPGTMISVKGDVFSTGEYSSLNLQTDSGVEISKKVEPFSLDERDQIWGRVKGDCIVVSLSSKGWYGVDLTICVSSEGDLDYVEMDLSGTESVIKAGDLIEVDGILWNDGRIKCYGSRSVKIIYRPPSVTKSLLGLLSDLSDSPSNVPTGKFDIVGYVRYEPSTTSLYISDETQGSTISLKVRIPEDGNHIHMGDLIKLVNTTLYWEGNGLRYVLIPEWIDVRVSHGPWNLNLDNLDYGISPYEGAVVSLRGDLIIDSVSSRLHAGNSSIEVRCIGPMEPAYDVSITGRVCYDTSLSAHYIEILECEV